MENKAFEEEFFKWKDEVESKYNHLSGAIMNLTKRVNFLNGKLSQWEQLEPLKKEIDDFDEEKFRFEWGRFK